jgi:hypothetical protein
MISAEFGGQEKSVILKHAKSRVRNPENHLGKGDHSYVLIGRHLTPFLTIAGGQPVRQFDATASAKCALHGRLLTQMVGCEGK